MSDYKNEDTFKSRWIKKELKKGNKILIKEIFLVPISEDWAKWEIFYISEYKKLGYKLTNTTSGGDGLHGDGNPFYGKKHSKESMLPTDVIDTFGTVFEELNRKAERNL